MYVKCGSLIKSASQAHENPISYKYFSVGYAEQPN